jgi:hypothetical protein
VEGSKEIDLKNTELLHNLSREKYNFLMDNIDKLDQKFTTLFSVDAVIISITISLNITRQTALFFVGLTLILVALIVAVIGYIPKTLHDIAIDKFWNENYSKDYKTTIESITSHIVEAYTRNRKVQDRKSERVNLAFIFSLAGIIIIVLSHIIMC